MFEGNELEEIHEKEDENSKVAWLPIEELDNLVNEENMKVIYKKIIKKMLDNFN